MVDEEEDVFPLHPMWWPRDKAAFAAQAHIRKQGPASSRARAHALALARARARARARSSASGPNPAPVHVVKKMDHVLINNKNLKREGTRYESYFPRTNAYVGTRRLRCSHCALRSRGNQSS